MTIQELINELSSVDEDVKQFEVWVVFRHQLSKNLKFIGRSKITEVPEGVDVDHNRLYLESDEQ